MKAKSNQRIDITELLTNTRSELYQEFDGLYAGEDALELLQTLQEYAKKGWTDAMGDPHSKLFEILAKSSPSYVRDHHDADGKAVSLLSSFSDVKAVKKALIEYEKYVAELPGKEEIELRFAARLFELYKNFKTSSDYMTRLTDRLLCDELRRDEPTQVRILRQFIYRFGCMEGTPYACKVIKEIADDQFGGDYSQMALQADTQLLAGLFASGNDKSESEDDGWMANICSTVEQRSMLIEATPAVKELVRRVFSPLVCKQGAEFDSACMLGDCFSESVTTQVQRSVKGSKKDAALLKQLIDLMLKTNPPAYTQYPVGIRLSTIARYYADTLTVSRDNPLLTHLPDVYLRSKTPPSKIFFPFNDIINAEKLKSIEFDFESNAGIDRGLELLEEVICTKSTTAYETALRKTADERLKNRIKTVRLRTVTTKSSDIAKLAKHLADGFFDSQKKTREKLYLYAVAFNMTFVYADGIPVDKKTDISINLFEDYYTDNLINYLGTEKNSGAEKCVDGYGINYKNFFEVIFLYYIVRRMRENADTKLPDEQRMTHLQLIQQAYAMIDRCAAHSRAEKDDAQIELDLQGGFDVDFTADYKQDFLTLLLNTSQPGNAKEKEFEDFVCRKYDCKKVSAATAKRSENRTAFSYCSQLYLYLNDFFFDSADTAGASDDKTESRAVAALRRRIVKKAHAMELVAENTRLRRNCTDCPYFEEHKWLHFDPQRKCKTFVENKCKKAGESFCKDDCAQCPTYLNMNIHRFVPSLDCPHHASCTFESPEAAKSKLKDSDYYKMIRHVLLREFDAMTKAYNESVCSHWLQAGDYDKDFCDLLRQIEQRLCMFTQFGSTFRMADTNRTALLTLYYMYLVLKSPEHKRCKVSFTEYYDLFCNEFTLPIYSDAEDDEPCKGINRCLMNAGYQKINSKNIFDVFVCFLAYRETYAPQYTFSELWNELLKTF